MNTRECLIQEEKTGLLTFRGEKLVVVQEFDGEFQNCYVVVPGFKVGGRHASSFAPDQQAFDVQPVDNADRKEVEELLRKRNFVGPINFW